MHRIKMFSSAMHGGEIQGLEAAINGWLESAHPTIRQVTQSGADEQVVVTFLYDDGHRAMQFRMASTAVPEAFEQSLSGLDLDPVEEEPVLLPEAELPY